MSRVKTSMCAIRRGRTNGLVLQAGAPATPGGLEMLSCDDFSFGEDFSATRISIGVPFGSRNQMPFELDAGRRIDPLDAQRVETLAEARQIVLERGKGDELQLLLRPLHHRAPAMGMAVGVDVQRVALRAHVEAEGGIERPRLLDVGNGEIEAVERMHAEFAGTAVDRLRERTDLRHRTAP